MTKKTRKTFFMIFVISGAIVFNAASAHPQSSTLCNDLKQEARKLREIIKELLKLKKEKQNLLEQNNQRFNALSFQMELDFAELIANSGEEIKFKLTVFNIFWPGCKVKILPACEAAALGAAAIAFEVDARKWASEVREFALVVAQIEILKLHIKTIDDNLLFANASLEAIDRAIEELDCDFSLAHGGSTSTVSGGPGGGFPHGGIPGSFPDGEVPDEVEQPPDLFIISPSPGIFWYNTDVTLDYLVEEGAEVIEGPPSRTTYSKEGVYYPRITANKGGRTTVKVPAFGIDKTAPKISIAGPQEGEIVTDPFVLVSAAVSDNLSGIDWNSTFISVDGITREGTSNILTLEDGIHTATVRTCDRAGTGNCSERTWSFLVDTTPPVIKGPTLVIAHMSCLFSCIPLCASVGISYEPYDATSGIASFVVSDLPPCLFTGTYTKTAVAIDRAGHKTELITQVIVLPPPDCDCPDENGSVSTLTPPSNPIEGPAVFAVFDTGFGKATQNLFGAFGEAVDLFVDIAALTNLSPYHALIFPSGGIGGYENNEALKAMLKSYVEQGGVLISFTMQRGYEFSVLPGSPSGYGYREDQSCHAAGTFLDQFHPVMTSQTDSVFDGGIDGFFMEWPKEAKILLRRVKNNLPAAVVYPHGQGFVVATTLYTDYAFGTGQLTQDEITFMKDLIAWAKNPKQEFAQSKPGETVSLPVQVTNSTAQDVGRVKFDVKDSSGTVIFTDTVSLSVPAGQTVSYTLTFTAPSALGIYSVFYQLIVDSQPLTDPVFADNVSITEEIQSTVPQKDLTFSVVSPGDFFLKGTPVTFTILVNNQGTVDRTVALAGTGHHIAENIGTFLIPAGTIKTIPFTTNNIYFTSQNQELWDFYLGGSDPGTGQSLLAFWQVGVAGTTAVPSVSISATLPKRLFSPGEVAPVSLSFKNLTPTAYEGTAQVQAFSPQNVKLFDETLNLSLSGSETKTQSVSIPVPSSAPFGVYPVVVNFQHNGQTIGSTTAFFEVPRAQVIISPTVPAAFSLNVPATVPFKLQNSGFIDVTGTLQVTLKDPDGETLFSETRPVSVAHGETQTEEFSITIPETKFGTYPLSYIFTTPSGDISGQVPIRSEVASTPQLTQNTYTVSDTVQAQVFLTNTGQVEQQFHVEALYLPTNFSQTNSITLQPNNSTTLTYTLPLSSAVPAGTQTVGVFFKAKNTLNRPFYFTILASKLTLSLPAASSQLSVGGTGNVEVKNTGGVGTSYDYTLTLQDLKGNIVLNTNGSDSISHSETKTISFTVPNTSLATGDYKLLVKVTDTGTGKKTSFDPFIRIEGLSATLKVTPEKTTYKKLEEKKVTSEITPQGGTLNNATLKLTVIKPEGGVSVLPIGSTASLLLDGDSLWFGTAYQGAVRMDKRTKQTQAFGPAQGLTGTYVYALAADSEAVYFGTDQGLFKYDKAAQAITPYVILERVQALANDGNSLWVGTLSGLFKVDKDTLTSVRFNTALGLVDNKISALALDGNVLYIGTVNMGISKYNKLNNTFETIHASSGLTDDRIKALAVDGNFVWIATLRGVTKLDKKAGTLTKITVNEGLVHNWVYSVASSGSKVYFGTWEGLSVLSLADGRLKTLTTADGLPSNFVRALAVDGETLYFGCFTHE